MRRFAMKAFTPFPASNPSNIADMTQIASAIRIAESTDIDVQEPPKDRSVMRHLLRSQQPQWRTPCSLSSSNLLLRLMNPPTVVLTPHRFEGERIRRFCTECQASGLRHNDRSRQDSSGTTVHHLRVSPLVSGAPPRHPQIDAVRSCRGWSGIFLAGTQGCSGPLAIRGYALGRSLPVLSNAHARVSAFAATVRRRSPGDPKRGKLGL